VDIASNAVKEAKKNLNFAECMDIVVDELPYNEKFDVIIFGDVLEHVAWPENILNKFKNYLYDDGIIIASIPNVANIITRINLLFGNWNYQNSGILDNTHLRFFTKKTALELFKKANLKLIKLEYTSLGVNKFIITSKFLTKIYPNLFSMQFIIISSL